MRRTSILRSQRSSAVSFFSPLLIRRLTISSARSFSASVSIGLGKAVASSSAYFRAVAFPVLAIAVIFPFLPVVFGVRQYESNQYGLIFVVNFGDEPVLIPGDVEDRTFQIRISVRERLPCFRK